VGVEGEGGVQSPLVLQRFAVWGVSGRVCFSKYLLGNLAELSNLLFDGLSHDRIIDFLQIHRPLIGEIKEEVMGFLRRAAPTGITVITL
jgi:hypothetical protein